MFNSGNMFGVTGHEIMKAISEFGEAARIKDEQQEFHAAPRQTLLQIFKGIVYRGTSSEMSNPTDLDRTCTSTHLV